MEIFENENPAYRNPNTR